MEKLTHNLGKFGEQCFVLEVKRKSMREQVGLICGIVKVKPLIAASLVLFCIIPSEVYTHLYDIVIASNKTVVVYKELSGLN